MDQMWVMVGVFVVIYGLCSFFQLPFVQKQMLDNYTEESVAKYCRLCGIPMMIFGVGFIFDGYSAGNELFATLRWIFYAIGAVPIVIFSFKVLVKKNNPTNNSGKGFFNKKNK